jgi:hypothetical protein
VTLSEERRRTGPRLSAEDRVRLGDEAWELKDVKGMSTRRIRDLFRGRGDDISHTTVWQLIAEAQERAQFLDFVGPAQSRATSVGRLDRMLEKVMKLIETYEAAIETGEMDIEKAGALLDKAHARYAQYEQIWLKVTGAAMPTRTQIEGPDGESLTPNLALFAELNRAVTAHEHKTKDMEENDGLDG